MIRFFKGGPIETGRAGILPAAFNPVTIAHLALADAAQSQYGLDQVVFLLPARLPHKEFDGASFEDRIAMLADALTDRPDREVASCEHGLFFEIARDFRAACGPAVNLHLLCGRDAAERILNWNYASPPSFAEQLREFQMLVASREGGFEIPAQYRGRIHLVDLPDSYDRIAASVVRKRVRSGEPWTELVPPAVARRIQAQGLYR